MNKLKTYENFDNRDINLEEKIDEILITLMKKKVLISMLRDTVEHVVEQVKSVIPKDVDKFQNDLRHYEEEVNFSFGRIRENVIDGYPNLKDMIEDIEMEFNQINEYLRKKFNERGDEYDI
jgi:hypothetical protein